MEILRNSIRFNFSNEIDANSIEWKQDIVNKQAKNDVLYNRLQN